MQVVASDNVAVSGFALTSSSGEPDVNASIWQKENTFSVTENGRYYVWVKDAAGNITGKPFDAEWICTNIWNKWK